MPDDPRPWKVVKTGPRHDYHVLRVGEDVFADPRGGEERRRVIIDADEWCNVVPLTRDGNVILIKQFRFGSRQVSLELPGGVVDRGEDPAGAVARELEEETGHRAGRIAPIGAYWSNPAHFTNRVHAFVAIDCERLHDGHPDDGEDLAIEIVPRASIASLVREGRISHALMLSSLHLATLAGYL